MGSTYCGGVAPYLKLKICDKIFGNQQADDPLKGYLVVEHAQEECFVCACGLNLLYGKKLEENEF